MSFKEQYRKVKQLGRGAFGSVYLTQQRDSPGTLSATKEIVLSHLTEKEREAAREESRLLEKITHPNVVGYITSFLEEKKLHIVMEYADGGDLASKICQRREAEKGFRESAVMTIFAQIASALQHIHDQGILHRDLKPMNVFLTKRGLVKLGDFGIARVLEGSVDAHTQVGTPFYLSPEVCKGEAYGNPSDIWSLGVMTYELSALKVPFKAASVALVAIAICSNQPDPLPSCYSKHLLRLVDSLLQKVPCDRPKLDHLLQTPFLQHYLSALPTLSPTEAQAALGGRQDIVQVSPEGASEVEAHRLDMERQCKPDVIRNSYEAPRRRDIEPPYGVDLQRRPETSKRSDGQQSCAEARQRERNGAGKLQLRDDMSRRGDAQSIEAGQPVEALQRLEDPWSRADAQREVMRQDAQHRDDTGAEDRPQKREVAARNEFLANRLFAQECKRRALLDDKSTDRHPFLAERLNDADIGQTQRTASQHQHRRDDRLSLQAQLEAKCTQRKDQEAEKLRQLEVARIQAQEDRRVARQKALARMAEDEVRRTSLFDNELREPNEPTESHGRRPLGQMEQWATPESACGRSSEDDALLAGDDCEARKLGRATDQRKERQREVEQTRLEQLENARLVALEDRRRARQRMLARQAEDCNDAPIASTVEEIGDITATGDYCEVTRSCEPKNSERSLLPSRPVQQESIQDHAQPLPHRMSVQTSGRVEGWTAATDFGRCQAPSSFAHQVSTPAIASAFDEVTPLGSSRTRIGEDAVEECGFKVPFANLERHDNIQFNDADLAAVLIPRGRVVNFERHLSSASDPVSARHARCDDFKMRGSFNVESTLGELSQSAAIYAAERGSTAALAVAASAVNAADDSLSDAARGAMSSAMAVAAELRALAFTPDK